MFHMRSPTSIRADSWLSQLSGVRVPLEMFSTQLHDPPHGRGPGTAPDGTIHVGGLSSSSTLRASLKTKFRGSKPLRSLQLLRVIKQSTDHQQKRARHRGRIPLELGLRVTVGHCEEGFCSGRTRTEP